MNQRFKNGALEIFIHLFDIKVILNPFVYLA